MAYRDVAAGASPLAIIVRHAILLVGVAFVLCALSWLLRTPRLPLLADAEFYAQELAAPVVSLNEALQLFEEGEVLFVDTRGGESGAAAYIPGAFAIRQESFADDLLEAGDFMFPDDELILYGGGNLSEVSAVAARFLERGYENVRIMTGGVEAWRSAGGPLNKGRESMP